MKTIEQRYEELAKNNLIEKFDEVKFKISIANAVLNKTAFKYHFATAITVVDLMNIPLESDNSTSIVTLIKELHAAKSKEEAAVFPTVNTEKVDEIKAKIETLKDFYTYRVIESYKVVKEEETQKALKKEYKRLEAAIEKAKNTDAEKQGVDVLNAKLAELMKLIK